MLNIENIPSLEECQNLLSEITNNKLSIDEEEILRKFIGVINGIINIKIIRLN